MPIADAAAYTPKAAETRAGILSAIRDAATRTGVNFAYLTANAAVESSFDPQAKAATSSATGLYQFIDSTWLSMVQRHGDKHGLGDYAALIETGADGYPRAVDAAAEREILALREDPRLAALMAGELAADNRAYLQKHTASPVGETELYLAHFFGARGAADFLNTLQREPGRAAAQDFPAAAQANPAIFRDKSGRPQSLQQIYDYFGGKLERARGANGLDKPGGKAARPADREERIIPQAPQPLPPLVHNGLHGAKLSFEVLLTLHALDPALPFESV